MARDRHAALRDGDHGRRDRRRDHGPAPGRRDAVRRLRLVRVGPPRHGRGQAALARRHAGADRACGCRPAAASRAGRSTRRTPSRRSRTSPASSASARRRRRTRKGLIIAAIEDPNPVLFFEHKHLYRRIKGEVPDERYVTPIGKARIAQEGEDLTIVTWGAMVYTAQDAAKQLPDVSVEIIDLRTVMPWDKQAVLESVRKTSKVLVLHEDTRTGGFGGEIAATVAEEAFEDLDAPVRRIAAPDTPGAVLAAAREGIHPPGRRRRPWNQGAGELLMATNTAVEVVMPQMGVSVSEGTITKWSKQVGDTVEADETLLEISTDKVDTEVPSPASGVVSEILVQEGETVEVGTVLARIGGEAGARRAEPLRPQPEPAPAPSAPRRRAAAAATGAAPAPVRAAAASAPARPGTARSFVSPVVARIAAEHGIDPTQVPGTGGGGRVTKKDIQAFIESGPPAPCSRRPAAAGGAGSRAAGPAPPAPPPAAPPAPAPAPAQAPARHRPRARTAGSRGRRELRADVRDAARDRRAHAQVARHVGARHERDRGRHVEGGRDPREAEEGVHGGVRRQPDVPRVHRACDDRDAARLPVRERRDPRRQDRDARTSSTSASPSSSRTARG